MKIELSEKRDWTSMRVRNVCVEYNFYTCGDNDEYTRMLNNVAKWEPTTENIYRIALDICYHSDKDDCHLDDLSVPSIMDVLMSKAVHVSFDLAYEFA